MTEAGGAGLTEPLTTIHPDATIYTFRDYFRNAHGRDAGLRVCHLPLNPALVPDLRDAQVDRDVRGLEKTSDHAPVWIDLAPAKRVAADQPSAMPAYQSA